MANICSTTSFYRNNIPSLAFISYKVCQAPCLLQQVDFHDVITLFTSCENIDEEMF